MTSTRPAPGRTLSRVRYTKTVDQSFRMMLHRIVLAICVPVALAAQTPRTPAPNPATASLPIILTRTPYGIAGAGGAFGTSYAELAEEGFIFAFQDIRGRFTSEGQFVMLRPPRDKRDPKAVDESSDTYDSIDWMLK